MRLQVAESDGGDEDSEGVEAAANELGTTMDADAGEEVRARPRRLLGVSGRGVGEDSAPRGGGGGSGCWHRRGAGGRWWLGH